MDKQRVAVVGGTGFVGSHLVEHLLRQGHEVLAIARGYRRTDILKEHPRLAFQAADITKRAEILSALVKFDPEVVYHMACQADAVESVDHVQACVANNTIGTVNTLEAAAISGARLFVFADSSKAYGNGPVPYRCGQAEDPICSYAIAKLAAWKLCTLLARQFQINLVNLRPTFVYGPRQNYNLLTYVEDSVRRNQPLRIQGGRQTRDLLFVDDAVRCFESVMHMPETWNRSIPIGGGREMPVAELCREMLLVLQSDLDVREEPNAVRPTEIWRSFCDNEDIARLTGWQPQMNLQEGLRRTFKPGPYYRAEACSAMEAVAT